MLIVQDRAAMAFSKAIAAQVGLVRSSVRLEAARMRLSRAAWAREALALPPGNQATYIQEVLVPAGTRLQRSRALPAFGRRGGAEQFQLLDRIPDSNFGVGVPFR